MGRTCSMQRRWKYIQTFCWTMWLGDCELLKKDSSPWGWLVGQLVSMSTKCSWRFVFNVGVSVEVLQTLLWIVTEEVPEFFYVLSIRFRVLAGCIEVKWREKWIPFSVKPETATRVTSRGPNGSIHNFCSMLTVHFWSWKICMYWYVLYSDLRILQRYKVASLHNQRVMTYKGHGDKAPCL